MQISYFEAIMHQNLISAGAPYPPPNNAARAHRALPDAFSWNLGGPTTKGRQKKEREKGKKGKSETEKRGEKKRKRQERREKEATS